LDKTPSNSIIASCCTPSIIWQCISIVKATLEFPKGSGITFGLGDSDGSKITYLILPFLIIGIKKQHRKSGKQQRVENHRPLENSF
jgi:hypothetical protein